MKRTNVFFTKAVISCLIVSTFLGNSISVSAINSSSVTKSDTSSDPLVVVSLGDSYSSGEGIEEFYGQEKIFFEKVKDEDWIAHRSTKSWPGQLDFSEYYDGISGTLTNYNVKDNNSAKCKWYFGAVSGAQTWDFENYTQGKDIDVTWYHMPRDLKNKIPKNDGEGYFVYQEDLISNDSTVQYVGHKSMPKQLEIFDEIKDEVDYVTLTCGGNDVHFSEIVTQCVKESPTIHYLFWEKKDKVHHKETQTHLEQKLNDLLDWKNKINLKKQLGDVYDKIAEKAPNAEIIVAGYPELFEKNGAGLPISKEEASFVNSAVTEFNNLIKEVISEKQQSGTKIHFVDVEAEFDKGGGHQAYSKDNWINPVWLLQRSQDLKDYGIGSSYSIHPNEKGAQAYARCVNKTIEEIEEKEKRGTISGEVYTTDLNDKDVPISNAKIYAFKLREDGSYNSNYIDACAVTDRNGKYSLKPLPVGEYKIIASASGYEGAEFDATIKYGQLGNNGKVLVDNSVYEKTYLPSEDSPCGILSGKVCKASDHSTPISNADIDVLTMDDNLYLSSVTDSSGNYELNLPVGEYKINISADGYIPFGCYATVVEDDVTYLETFLMVEGEEGQIGVTNGTVFDSLTGNGVDDVALTIYKGWNNPKNTEIISAERTNSYGEYSVELPYGNYTVYAEKDGYITSKFNIIVQEGTTSEQNGTIVPTFMDDEYHIVLTWGKDPKDLDSHVEGKLSSGRSFHVYYEHMSESDGKITVCELDVDDTTSYGPETVTLRPTAQDAYYYYIYKYAGDGTVASSEAKIVVYKGEDVVKIFNVPSNLGTNDYWNVFAIKDGELIVQNTITSYADTSYAE